MTKTVDHDVIVIGAGFSGICAAIKLGKAGIDYAVVDKSDNVGGTWWENTYPGAACDVPSHFYCYSFEPNPNWSRKFAPQKEIHAYIDHCAVKYGVKDKITFGLYVKSVVLDEKAGVWTLNFADGGTKTCRHVINGMGGLHKPNIPPFKGKDRFKGPSMHSAKWDHSVDYRGKTVSVIGSAASAIQVIPELQKACKQVNVFQRTPNYIAPRYDRNFTDKEKKRFTKMPLFGRLYRWLLYKRMDVLVYRLTKPGSLPGKQATKGTQKWIRESISDKDLQEAMIPNYTIGCKRILLSDTFYETITKDNVSVITSGIEQIKQDGIETRDGMLHASDIIVYATGFDLWGHMRSIHIVGKDGVSAEDLGLDGEEAFKGAVHSQFPNYYSVTGPNTGVGTTSVVYMIEVQCDYILKLIKAAGMDQLISVKPEAMKAYNDRIHADLAKSVWASGCDSWYVREDGKIVTLYPGNAKQFAKEHKKVDLSNYTLTTIAI